jgi:4a-hydroxytetrahydrobiopterin dehydratase
MTSFACRSAAEALELVAAIGELAERANHHPDVDWRYNQLFVTTVSHDVGAITERDIALAGQISAAATNLHAIAKPEKARTGA